MNKIRRSLKICIPLIFWLAVWQLAATLLRKPLLLPTPLAVFRKLSMVTDPAFLTTVGMSLLRAGEAYLLGVLIGAFLAILCDLSPLAACLLTPALSVVRATPVASFIILALVWLGAAQVPVLAGILMVTPVIFANTAEGIRSTDPLLLEMADGFRFGRLRTWLRLILPSAFPAFVAACEACVGLCFKASIAAEVIGVPKNAIGSRLHSAKVYLETDTLLAWTLVVILLSMILEKLLKAAMERGLKHVHRP